MFSSKEKFLLKFTLFGAITLCVPTLLLILLLSLKLTSPEANSFYTLLGVFSLVAGITWNKIYFPTNLLNQKRNGRFLPFIFNWFLSPVFATVVSATTYCGIYFWTEDRGNFYNWFLIIIFICLGSIKFLKDVWNFRINLPKKRLPR